MGVLFKTVHITAVKEYVHVVQGYSDSLIIINQRRAREIICQKNDGAHSSETSLREKPDDYRSFTAPCVFISFPSCLNLVSWILLSLNNVGTKSNNGPSLLAMSRKPTRLYQVDVKTVNTWQ